MPSRTADGLTTGALVAVRGQKWVVSDVDAAEGATLVALQSVEDGRYGDTLEVIWDVEPGRQILPSGSLPEVTEQGFDPPRIVLYGLLAWLGVQAAAAIVAGLALILGARRRRVVVLEEEPVLPF